MAIKKKKLKTRLDLIQEELDNQVYVVEENGKKVADSRNPNLPLHYTNKRLETAKNNDIAPVKKTNTNKNNTSYMNINKKSDNKWFSKGAFSDGYQVGDLTKTILGTTGDVATNVTKSLFGLGEGIGDAINYGIAGIADVTGKERFADDLRTGASESLTDKIFKPAEDFFDKNSVLGERSDQIAHGLGYVGGIIATGGLGASAGLGAAGTTALTTGLTGVSSFGSGVGEAYQGGATDEEAHLYGLIAGAAEAGSELIFGGLGKGVNALGLSKGLSSADDMLAKKVTEKISNQLFKNLTQFGIKSGAEGLEEVISGVVQGIGKKVTYMSEEELGEILANEQLLDQFIMGAVTSGVSQSGIVPGMKQGSLIETTKTGKDFVTGYTQNEQKVVDSLVEEQSNELSKQKAIENAIKEAITTRETEQKGILSVKEKTALTEGIKAKIENGEIDVSNTKLTNKEISKIRQEVEDNLQKGLLDTNKIDSILGDTITENDSILARSYQETAKRSQNFTYDSNKVTNEQEKAVYDSATKYFNDTTRSHEFVEKVANIAKDKGTNYGFINNEELKALGHDVEGKQVNGLVRTTQDGKQTVLINIDSPKTLNTIVGHETTHLLEGTIEYQELQEAIFNYAKEKGEFDTRQKSLNELYEGIENANVDSELTADLVGDYLFTDEKFIDSLSTQKPTLFQKIKDLIDDLVIRFKGTKEEQQLREVQKKFRKAYKKNAQSTESTQYSLTQDRMKNIEGTVLTNKDGYEYTIPKELHQGKGKPKNPNSNVVSLAKYGDGDYYTPRYKRAESYGDVTTYTDIQDKFQNPYIQGTPYNSKMIELLNEFKENNPDRAKYIDRVLNNGMMLTQEFMTPQEISNMYVKAGYDSFIGGTDSMPEYLSFNKETLTNQNIKYSLNKVSKQYLEKQFKELTGDDILKADAVLGGVELRNNMRKAGNRTDAIENIPYSDEAMEIYKTYKNSRKSSNALYHTTSRENLQSILEKGLTANNPARQAGVSGEGKLYVAANEELANSFGEDTDILFRIDPNYNLENLDYDLIGGEGTYSTSDNIPVSALQVKENGKWVKLENSQLAKENIQYSLTPDYGMQHRPSTDYGDASNFEENMPDVFEHPEWYFFGSDARSKKAYRESFEALKKVRNNPEGEITIYRATIGDTFNEGDWVSPSKTYAEWHNESNLDGKGKVIELKVKAKDIRFAGDDLNEFGYFPNGVDEYSLSNFNEQRAAAKGNYNVYGEDVKLKQTIAPLQEEIKTLTETVQELKEQIAPVQEVKEVEYTQPSKAELENIMALMETGGTEYANTFFKLRDKYGQRNLYKAIREYKKAPDTYEAPIKGDEFAPTPQNIVEQQGQEAFNNIDESSIPGEVEDIAPDINYEMTSTESLFETRDYEEVGNRKVNAYQYDNPEVKPFFQEEAQSMLGELQRSIKGERNYNDDLYYATNGEQGFYGTQRQTTDAIAELLDGMDGKYKYTYADIEKGLNAIIKDEGS